MSAMIIGDNGSSPRAIFPRPKVPKFTFIDLYAGIGGIRLAFQLEGGLCTFSSEWDRFAQITYAHNFGEVPQGDIKAVSSTAIPNHDILVAGFPCQPFSIAGVSKKNALGRPHGFGDAQGAEFHEIVRILLAKQPSAFLLENVRNLQRHDKGRTFRLITEALNSAGYVLSHSVIDAAVVVPQRRERIYVVGMRKNLGVKFEFPRIRVRDSKVSDVLQRNVPSRYTLSDALWSYLRQYAEKHRKAGNGFGFGVADLDGKTRTLSARYYKDGAEILIPQRGKNPRRLTPRECARLMGFPEQFTIPVSDRQAYQQFGNSAVVPLIRQLARAMWTSLESCEGSKRRTVAV